jgi:hypothetical protein
MIKYLWRHEPMLSAEPVECLKHLLFENENTICEMAVFKLENDDYCFVKLLTEDKSNVQCGLTDIEEFKTEKEAVEIFDSLKWENE